MNRLRKNGILQTIENYGFIKKFMDDFIVVIEEKLPNNHNKIGSRGRL